MTPDSLAAVRAMDAADFAAVVRGAATLDARLALLRHRLVAFPAEGMAMLWPAMFRLGFASAARRHLVDTLGGLPPYAPGERETDHYAVEAPRGQGKTTLLERLPAVRAIGGLERCIVYVCRSDRAARSRSRSLRAALRAATDPHLGGLLGLLYPELRIEGGIDTWSVTTRHGTCHFAFRGFKAEVRGINLAGGERPTLILLDDLDKADVSAGQRDEEWETVTKDIGGLGPPDGGHVLYLIGTRLYPDAKTVRAREEGWNYVTFSEVIRWPDRADLWAQCHAAWAAAAVGEGEGREDQRRRAALRRAAAEAFYAAHKADMDAGAEVLDPDGQPILECYLSRWSMGDRAYWAEKQNLDADPSASSLPMGAALRCRFDGRILTRADGSTVPLGALRLAAYLDPKTGSDPKRGDYACLTLVAADADGREYVLRQRMERATGLDAHRAMLWALYDDIGGVACAFGVESNGGQGWVWDDDASLRGERERRRRAGLRAGLVVEPIPTTANKEREIAAMEPALRHGWLQVADSIPAPCWEQWERHPHAAHDDAPDSAAKALRLIRAQGTGGGGQWAARARALRGG